MRIRLEKRLTPSRFMQIATPIASVLLTMAARRDHLPVDRLRRAARDL